MTSFLLQLPRELIYMIVAADAEAVVYNTLLRTCHSIHSLFTLSVRLDYMVDFGVTVIIRSSGSARARIEWHWCDQVHDIYGPALTWYDGSVGYRWRGMRHAVGRPAAIDRDSITWYYKDERHRDLSAPAGTGVEWLRGAAMITADTQGTYVRWYTHGQLVRAKIDMSDASRAEVAYWWARRIQ